MGALGEGIGPDTDEGIRLCNLLNLDPAEVQEIRIVIAAGEKTYLEWTGRRHVPMGRIVDALTDALDDHTPGDTPDWIPGNDPWGTPPTPPC